MLHNSDKKTVTLARLFAIMGLLSITGEAIAAPMPQRLVEPYAVAAQLAPSDDKADDTAAAQQPVSLDSVCPRRRRGLGTIIGAVVGAAAGAILTGDVAGAAVGAVAGGLGGRAIGSAFDRRSCEQSRAAVALALQTGRTQSWQSEDGTRAFTLAVDRRYNGTSTIDRNINLLQDRQLVLENMVDANEVYAVRTARINLRDRPSTTGGSAVVGSLTNGVRLLAMGQSRDNQWLLVSSNGQAAEGWVSAALLTPLPDVDPNSFAQSGTMPVRAQRVAMTEWCMQTREEFRVNGQSANGAVGDACRAPSGAYVARTASAARS